MTSIDMKNKILLLCISIVTVFLLNGCTFGFSNARIHIPQSHIKVYLPSAKDDSIYGGQSARLSFAIRERLSHTTDLQFTAIKNARWALDVKILDKVQKIEIVDTCNNPGNPIVASGAYFCNIIHPEFTTGNPDTSKPISFNQPYVSPNMESTMLYVQVRAVDLDTGKLMWAKNYSDKNLAKQIFNEIGDPGDGRTITNMKSSPNLHALRYREAIDVSVQILSDRIAQDIQTLIYNQFSVASN